MSHTFKHFNKNSAPMMDQDWSADVTKVVAGELGWDGVALSPKATNITINKASGHGIFVDTVTPTYPWADLLGDIKLDNENASNRPTFNTYIDGMKQYQFAVNDRVYNSFHIPHDYVPGTDMYVHSHWSINSADTGTVTWQFDVSYAKGHGQGTFEWPKYIPVSQAYTGSFKHMIAETQMSATGNVALIDST